MASQKILFIDMSNQADAATTHSQRRVAYAHAARATHARRRQTRIKKSQQRDRIPDPQEKSCLHVPAPVGLLSSDRTDPFMSFVVPLTPVEHFLLDHYVRTVVPLLSCHESSNYYVDHMIKWFVPLALANAGLLNGVFLAASRHLAENHHQEQKQLYLDMAMQYKLRCVRSLRGKISAQTPLFSDSTVATAVALAVDELLLRDIAMFKRHILGAAQMVSLKGGPQTLGLDGFLEHLLSNFVRKLAGLVGQAPKASWNNMIDVLLAQEGVGIAVR